MTLIGVGTPRRFTVLAATHAVEAARAQIRIAQSDFLPSVGLSASVSRRYDIGTAGDRLTQASVMGKISFPLFDGGVTASRMRESRSITDQRTLDLDSARDRVRNAVVASWGVFAAARNQLTAAETRAKATGSAVHGITLQYQMGEKSLTDVLNGQQEYLAARESLVTAKRDIVQASFSVAQAMGILTVETLQADLREAAPPEIFVSTPVVREWSLRATKFVSPASGPCPGCEIVGQNWNMRLSSESLEDSPLRPTRF